MKDNTQVFESYSVPRAVRTLALPSMMGMLVNIVYNLADTFFVGQTGNANMVAAVSVTMPLFLLFIACGNLFGVGGCAFVSRSLGEGKTERVKTISSFCVYSAIGVGLVMTVLFLVFRKPVLYAVGASDATFAYAADYLKYVAIGSPFIVSSVMLGNLAQGVQPLVGYCYGANKLDRMRHSIRFSCICNIVLGTVITVIYFIFTRQVVSVFIDDPAVIDYGVKMLRALMISGPVIGCMFVLNFSFQGMGKGTQSMILSLSRQGLIYFPLLIIMNKTVGLDGIIWSQAVADLVCTAMSVVMFLLVVRKLRRQHSQKTKA